MQKLEACLPFSRVSKLLLSGWMPVLATPCWRTFRGAACEPASPRVLDPEVYLGALLSALWEPGTEAVPTASSMWGLHAVRTNLLLLVTLLGQKLPEERGRPFLDSPG